MEFLAILLVVAFYGLVVFGVVLLVRRVRGDRQTREAVETLESGFE